MKRCGSLAAAVVVGILGIACSQVATPVSPSHMPAVNAPPQASLGLESTSYTAPVITMMPDYTVSPSYVRVKVGYRVKFVNNSGRYFQIHSYNCSQFQMVDPEPGYAVNTMTFRTAGRVCDFFAWDTNWSKLMEGRVEVVP